MQEAREQAAPPAPEWMTEPTGLGQGVPTLFLSDVHYGEVVDRREMNGVNEYNEQIADHRLHRTVESSIQLLRHHIQGVKYPGIVLALGGDMFSGDIHEELAKTNDNPPMVSFVHLRSTLEHIVAKLADEFGKVYVPCVTGNHGRLTKKMQAKNRAGTNIDWLLYQEVAHAFEKDKRVKFNIPTAPDCRYEVLGTRYLLTHGDQFHGGSGIAGIHTPILAGDYKKRSNATALGKPFDIMLMGHWHQLKNMGRVIVNGSVKGYDEYAASGNFAFEAPQQALWITVPNRGVVYWMPVQCEDPAEKRSTEWVRWEKF